MKKIIAIFTCLFFNSLFSSSYYEAMKRIQCFRSLNPKTQSILRGHAAGYIAETFENNYLDTLQIKKASNKQLICQNFVKNSNFKSQSSQESSRDDKKRFIEKLKLTFGEILKKNMLLSHSILELKESKEYKDLIARYPVVENPEYQALLCSILTLDYQNYHLSLDMKDDK